MNEKTLQTGNENKYSGMSPTIDDYLSPLDSGSFARHVVLEGQASKVYDLALQTASLYDIPDDQAQNMALNTAIQLGSYPFRHKSDFEDLVQSKFKSYFDGQEKSETRQYEV